MKQYRMKGDLHLTDSHKHGNNEISELYNHFKKYYEENKEEVVGFFNTPIMSIESGGFTQQKLETYGCKFENIEGETGFTYKHLFINSLVDEITNHFTGDNYKTITNYFRDWLEASKENKLLEFWMVISRQHHVNMYIYDDGLKIDSEAVIMLLNNKNNIATGTHTLISLSKIRIDYLMIDYSEIKGTKNLLSVGYEYEYLINEIEKGKDDKSVKDIIIPLDGGQLKELKVRKSIGQDELKNLEQLAKKYYMFEIEDMHVQHGNAVKGILVEKIRFDKEMYIRNV